MKTNLKMMAAIAAVGMTIVSCSSGNENLVENVKPGKAHVKVMCGMGVSVSPMGAPMRTPISRAALSANGKTLTNLYILDYPTPSVLIAHPLYRLPTRLEAAQVLKYADLPEGYWLSKQRIVCVDSQPGSYYTFVPHDTVKKAGTKTKYCILPIRTERTSEEEHVGITVNDEWD